MESFVISFAIDWNAISCYLKKKIYIYSKLNLHNTNGLFFVKYCTAKQRKTTMWHGSCGQHPPLKSLSKF
jgi:hypothetical protein